jgi:hypothetical protein
MSNYVAIPSTGTTSLAGFFHTVDNSGTALIWHASEGMALVGLGIAVFALSFVWSKSRGVRISSGLSLVSILAAAYGGFRYVSMTGISQAASSTMMAGAFLEAYALLFVALYYAK